MLVTGPTGSGKSSTLAALIDLINETRADHILTIEDPIEFLHPHKKATVHQRELHSDTPTFALALRAALRQAPKVILVGEMRDRETIEIALTAAETGHLVFSTLHTIDASKTVERIVGAFETGDQRAVRGRLAASFRYFVSQRLIPKKEGGRVAVLEILKSTLRTRDYMESGEGEGKTLLDAMRDGEMDGMQYFDGEIEKLVRAGVITSSTGLLLRDQRRQPAPPDCRRHGRRHRRRRADHLLTGAVRHPRPATPVDWITRPVASCVLSDAGLSCWRLAIDSVAAEACSSQGDGRSPRPGCPGTPPRTSAMRRRT